MMITGLFETRATRLATSVAAMLTVMILGLLLAPGVAHAYEVHVSITGAGQVTETTSANLVGSGCVTSATNPTGAVGKDCYPGDPSGDYGWSWTVRYVATPKPGYSFARWQSDGSPKPVICDNANGSSTYTGAACQFATYDNLQTRAVFVDDTDPSMNSLSGPNQVVNRSATFTFSAAADPTFRRFECRVVGVHDWQTCSSGHTENPGTGTYTLQIRAVDWSNNLSAESTWTWTVDKVTPETTLTSGPNGTVSSTSASFEFNSNEAGTFLCTLDGATVGCGSPKNYTGLSQGPHTFQVRARDAAGNEDPTPTARTWTVDTVAPASPVISRPAGDSLIDDSIVTVSGTAEANSTVEVFDGTTSKGTTKADAGGDWSKALIGVADGSHTYTARARDSAGNTSATSNTRTVVVDTTNPTVETRKPTGKKVSPTAKPFVTFSEAMNETSVEASANGKPTTFILKKGTRKVGASVTYVETTTGVYKAILKPNKKLQRGATYTASVTAAAKDEAGNALVAKTWKFRVRP